MLVDLEKYDRVERLHCPSPVPIPLLDYFLLRISYLFWLLLSQVSGRLIPFKSSVKTCLHGSLLPETSFVSSLYCWSNQIPYTNGYQFCLVLLLLYLCLGNHKCGVTSLMSHPSSSNIFQFQQIKDYIGRYKLQLQFESKQFGKGITEIIQRGRFFYIGESYIATYCTFLVQGSPLKDLCSVALAWDPWLYCISQKFKKWYFV